ncbi:MAG: S41 family peptidase [Candidatus Limnocylindrales bacterium]
MIRPHIRHLALTGTAVLALTVTPASVQAADDEPPVLDEALIAEVLEVIAERFVDDDVLDAENLSVGAIRGIVDALGDDGHTQYLTEEEYKVEQEVLQGRVAGIGVVVDERSGAPVVISVVDGSPADRAGLRAGDIIATVDGVETARLPEGELADLVRGEPRTMVTLEIERPGETAVQKFGIFRADVEIDPVSWAMAPGSDVAVIRIVQFSVGSGHQVREAVEQARDEGATGYVLDLRGNPGGLVNELLNAASAFLDEGVAFLERGRDDEPVAVEVDPGRVIDPDRPVVALVDYGTASSGEILAAALRDNDRATVVGEQTFGTGTILNTLRLSDGSALRLGVREWLTPTGEGVFRVGLAPDEEVVMPLGATRLGPADLLSLTAVEFENSADVPLRHAVRLAEAEARD